VLGKIQVQIRNQQQKIFQEQLSLARWKKLFPFLLGCVILEASTWKFPGISYFSDLGRTRCARKIRKPVFITIETTFSLYFRKYFVVSFWSHSIKEFSVLLEDSLKIISET
jgi:hypothetical protein